jgi:hypothetical protein
VENITTYNDNLGSNHPASLSPPGSCQNAVAQTPSTLAVLGDEGEEVEGAADGGETDESKGEGVTLDVLGSILGQEAEGGDDPTAVTEADLEGGTNAAPQVSTDC